MTPHFAKHKTSEKINGVIILLMMMYNFNIAATLSGKITDQNTAQPVAGAIVLLENTEFSTTTDENGDYLIDNIPDGIYNVLVGGIHYKQKVYRHFGIGIYAGLEEEENSQQPVAFRIHQNYPNPFNPQTTISYEIPRSGHVTLEIFDAIGRHVVTLTDQHHLSGIYSIQWDAQNEKHQKVASGIYYLRIRSGTWQEILKMALIE